MDKESIMKKYLNEEEKKQEIKVEKEEIEEANSIPCLYLPNQEGSQKIMLYFHGDT